jgi:DNA-binding CsgD family transcriptional regulator
MSTPEKPDAPTKTQDQLRQEVLEICRTFVIVQHQLLLSEPGSRAEQVASKAIADLAPERRTQLRRIMESARLIVAERTRAQQPTLPDIDLNEYADLDPEKRPVVLSPRERDVYDRLKQNLTTPMIAKKIGIAKSTVEGHVKRVRYEFNVATRKEVVASPRPVIVGKKAQVHRIPYYRRALKL